MDKQEKKAIKNSFVLLALGKRETITMIGFFMGVATGIGMSVAYLKGQRRRLKLVRENDR